MKLRGYQREALRCIREQLAEHKSTLLTLATGLGKTVIFSHLIAEQSARSMVLAHRTELIEQAARTIRQVTGRSPDIEQAERFAMDYIGGIFDPAPCVVSSVQTQISGRNGYRRMHRFKPDEFGLLVIDEAHHAAAKSYRAIVQHYRQNPALNVLGVTATPDRADEKSLGPIFKTEAYRYEIRDAIADGWLVPIQVLFETDVKIDITDVPKSAGDFNQKILDRKMSEKEIVLRIAHPTYRDSGDRRTLVFATSVDQAEQLCAAYNAIRDGCARVVSERTPTAERREIIRDYRNGRFRILVNVAVATEGFDVPEIECVVLARPTMSRALMAQMIGRGTRPLPGIVDDISDDENQSLIDYERGDVADPAALRRRAIERSAKRDLLVIDLCYLTRRHSVATPLHVLAGGYEDKDIELAVRQARSQGKPVRSEEALSSARQRRLERIEQMKRIYERVKAKVRYRTQKMDIFEVMGGPTVPEAGWQRTLRPTEAQLNLLRRFRIPIEHITSRAQASAVIGRCLERERKGLCTFRQAKYLRRFGYDPTNITKAEATRILTEKFGRG